MKNTRSFVQSATALVSVVAMVGLFLWPAVPVVRAASGATITSLIPENGYPGETVDVTITGEGFVGSDADDANTELMQAEVSIEACLFEAIAASLDAPVTGWNGSEGQVTAGGGAYDASDYLSGGLFKATYDVSSNGDVTNGTNVSWNGVVWNAVDDSWDAETPTTVSFESGVTVNSCTVYDTTVLIVNITIDDAASLGPIDVSVTTPAGTTTLSDGFAVVQAYKVGALFAVTGVNASIGFAEKQTMEMMEQQVNASGGVGGYPLQVITYDTQSDVTQCLTLAAELIASDNVLAIIGPSTTGESSALVDTVTTAQIPLLSCGSGQAIVTPVDQRYWVFKTAPKDLFAVQRVYDYLSQQSIDSIAILTDTSAYGAGGRTILQNEASKYGITVVADETFGPSEADMTAQLTVIKNSSAEAVVCWGAAQGSANVAQNMVSLGMTMPLFCSNLAANQTLIDMGGDAVNGVILPTGKLPIADQLPDSDPRKWVLLQYKTDFEAEYGSGTATTFGCHAYDALTMVAMAIENAGPTRTQIRDYIEDHVTNFVGLSGIFNMSDQDHCGLGVDALTLVKIVNRRWASFPVITSVNPESGYLDETLALTVAGGGFIASDVGDANMELVHVQVSIEACLAEANEAFLDASATDWDGTAGHVTAGGGAFDASDYLSGGALKATYDMSINGNVTNGTNVSWYGVSWDAVDGHWHAANPTTVSLGAGITVNSCTVYDATEMTVNITIDDAASLGPRDVSVTTPVGTATLVNAFSIVAQPGNHPPNQPSNVSPTPAAINVSLTPTLESSGFTDADGDVHAASQWQVTTTSGNYASTVFDSSTDNAHLTSIAVPALSYSSTYYWHVRHQDGHEAWSDWSAATYFTTVGPAPVVTTGEASSTANSARLNGELTSRGTATSVSVSFVWGTSQGSYPNEVTIQAPMTGTGAFYADLSGLAPGTTYYYKAKAAGNGISHGNEKSFTTSTNPPAVTTNAAGNLTTNSARLNGELTSTGTAASVSVSFVWGTSPGSYANEITIQTPMTGTGVFSLDLNGLVPGTTYYYKAKAAGHGNAVYGPEVSFATGQIPVVESVDPGTGKRKQHLTVTISGANFDGAKDVYFGSDITVENFTVVSGTEITAEIVIGSDAAKEARDVSVTTAWGTGTKAEAFSVTGGGGGICSRGSSSGTSAVRSEVTPILAALGILLGTGYWSARRREKLKKE